MKLQLPQFLNNEDAVSYGFFIIAVFLVGISALWLMFAPTFNIMSDSYNSDIDAGMVTTQNQQSMQFHYDVIKIAPLIFILGLSAWGIIRALQKRQEA